MLTGQAWVMDLSLWVGTGVGVRGFFGWQVPGKQGEGLGSKAQGILDHLGHSLLL